jgi:hypothetical protein
VRDLCNRGEHVMFKEHKPKTIKAINLRFIVGASVITLLLAYCLPSRQISDIERIFGYPFGWFSVFNDTIGDVILSSTLTNVIPLLLNIIICYITIFWISKAIKHIRFCVRN